MEKILKRIGGIAGIGLTWALVWGFVWIVIFTIIRFVEPDSIDPGENAAAVSVFGLMGIATGVVFGLLLSSNLHNNTFSDQLQTYMTLKGILASAIVQVFYLNHGDRGLVANIPTALLITVFSGFVTMIWIVIVRKWLVGKLSMQKTTKRESDVR